MNSATLEQNEQQTQNHQYTTTSKPPQSSPSQSNQETANSNGLSLAGDVRFTDFNVSDSLKNRLTNAGFTTPTPFRPRPFRLLLKATTFSPPPQPAPAKPSASSSR